MPTTAGKLTWHKRIFLSLVLTWGASARAAAVDSLAFTYGHGDGVSVNMARVALQFAWNLRWLNRGNWHLSGYWDVEAGRWFNNAAARTNDGLWELGAPPVFRWQQTARTAIAPYLEAGVGAHLFSKTSVSADRRFGTAFQFGSFAGIGIRFGSKHAYDLSYRFHHLSNAGIKQPNTGIDFHQARLGYWF